FLEIIIHINLICQEFFSEYILAAGSWLLAAGHSCSLLAAVGYLHADGRLFWKGTRVMIIVWNCHSAKVVISSTYLKFSQNWRFLNIHAFLAKLLFGKVI
ncbi:MAG: hypothetical protein PVH01_00220, partial [Desulfobacterales bacterium]